MKPEHKIKANLGYNTNMNKYLKITLVITTIALAATLLMIAAIYLWPLKTKHLQTGKPETISNSQSLSRIDNKLKNESKRSVNAPCQTQLLSHGSNEENAAGESFEEASTEPRSWNGDVVVFFHGITSCPDQFKDLAKHFYDKGYNVYIPLAPYHGTESVKEHSKITANELIDYVNESITVATGLGNEVGVVGLSGGGLLGTWAAEYRPEVKRLLLLSPFYEPASSQAPKWQIPFMKVLYGKWILPDAFSNPENPENPGFSYRALAQYIIIKDNLKSNPENINLNRIGVVVSEDDDSIDKDLANSIPSKIAESNNLKLLQGTIPGEWQTGHSISSTDVPGVKKHQKELFNLYLNFYSSDKIN